MSDFKINSTRVYSITGFVRGILFSSELTTLESLIKNSEDQEFIYALQEDLDAILDLKVGTSLYVKLDRDNTESLGAILRIK